MNFHKTCTQLQQRHTILLSSLTLVRLFLWLFLEKGIERETMRETEREREAGELKKTNRKVRKNQYLMILKVSETMLPIVYFVFLFSCSGKIQL